MGLGPETSMLFAGKQTLEAQLSTRLQDRGRAEVLFAHRRFAAWSNVTGLQGDVEARSALTCTARIEDAR